MTTFGWKKKAGQKIAKEALQKFFSDSEADNKREIEEDEFIKWKKKKTSTDENLKSKSEEYKKRGELLAQQDRYQEAVSEWDKSLSLFPKDEKTLEMKAQALLELNEPYLAVLAAEKAVQLNPLWWVAYQTLGRSQLGIGDLQMAKKSFSKAIHLNPLEKELWKDDLEWTLTLIKKKEKLENETAAIKLIQDLQKNEDLLCQSSVN